MYRGLASYWGAVGRCRQCISHPAKTVGEDAKCRRGTGLAFRILEGFQSAIVAKRLADRLDIKSISMKSPPKKQALALWRLSLLLLLNGCGVAGPECDTLETRNSVVEIISDDSNNALVNFAVNNSSSVAAMVGDAKTDAEKSVILEKARQGAVYMLDDTIVTNSRATRVATCSGLLSVTVGDTTAEKQVDFKVERTADGKISVSVNPFLF
jgi:hypothetical protein